MSSPLVSVIVPVYKVEHYLERCVKSLINQTYENLEIILVDDGSPDSCPSLCDSYEAIYNNIRVIHKKNGGLSSARNAGLAIAAGDYIGFVDSDDWVDNDFYEHLLHLIQEHHADAAHVLPMYCYTETEQVHNQKETVNVFSGKNCLQYYMTSSTINGSYSVWKFLYRSSIVKGLRFREGKINEDIDFNYKAISACKTIVVSNLKKYYYFQGGDSLSSAGLKKRDFDLYDAADELSKLTQEETFGTIKYLGEVKNARTAMSLLSKLAFYGIADETLDRKEIVRKLVKENRKNALTLLKSPIPFSRKCLTVGFCISYKTTEAIIRIYKIISTKYKIGLVL